ncbi:MAG: hypothetical protein FWG63_06130 [Defluviitaleaceae bacterium]|nr:hypothetical protein [Defluviitaleaceae bacterium]
MKFTKEDREDCVGMVMHILELARTARRHGILALEDELEEQDNPFLKMGLELLVDGTDPGTLTDIFNLLLEHGDYTPKEYLERLVISRGVVAIQMGHDNPIVMAVRLYAILGEDFLHYADTPYQDTWAAYHEILQKYNDRPPLPCSLPFEKRVAKLTRRDIQLIYTENTSDVLALALPGCSIVTIKKFLENTSKRRCLEISMLMLEYPPQEEAVIVEHQNVILNLIKRLEIDGAIATIPDLPKDIGTATKAYIGNLDL